MCGRFTLTASDVAGLRQRFGVDEAVEVRRRFNAAPGDEVLTVGPEGGALRRWGYLRESAYTTINARAETLRERPTWRTALREGRCLVPADGWFEWRRMPDGSRRPHWITRADRAPFAFAGLASPFGTVAIVTTAATPQLAELHDRMPVVLAEDAEAEWADPATASDAAHALLAPFAATRAVPVGPAVNDARHDAPDCVVEAELPLSLF